MEYEYVKQNIETILSDIQAIKKNCGREDDKITLLAVTKTHEADVINASIEFGVNQIAENRVQEITRKYPLILPNIDWHLIGHLQSNKVKVIIDKIALIHSVDSDKLLTEIDKRAGEIDKIQDVLIQINAANETQKSGVSPNDLSELLKSASKLSHIRVIGLMNIAPFTDDEMILRENFKIVKRLYDSLDSFGYQNVFSNVLSMGMSNDYKIAIEEGSTMIRVGTKIYGKRDYSNS